MVANQSLELEHKSVIFKFFYLGEQTFNIVLFGIFFNHLLNVVLIVITAWHSLATVVAELLAG
jgi:hypothetical protein